ncbi:DUF961 family protein [Listeria sp. FSL L7-1509]|uniref:DUF961 family protein n=1 Tax=Listeria immobilis TaxID=2713502 RepID=A0ABR6SUM2_9LIST|nr:DUF961 family protein [Listeria immobilis]MBC1506335.1 DUF961 family protein [Listeria immobilis]MBC1509384.1 DUF961 family protein [Listeria immobilis]MBC6304516.1 DUF961 family protein [Listeria immobilis]MBC6312081.1 DUF961 family protein [Listeria immobilis]
MKLILKSDEYGELQFIGRAQDYDKGTGFGRSRKITHHAYKVYGTAHSGGLLVFIPMDAPTPNILADDWVTLKNPVISPSAQGGIVEFDVYCEEIVKA